MLENELTPTPPIEEPTKWFALLCKVGTDMVALEYETSLAVARVSSKCKKRLLEEFATNALFLGSLTDKKERIVEIVFKNIYTGIYPVYFLPHQDLQNIRDVWLTTVLHNKENVLGAREKALGLVSSIAAWARTLDENVVSDLEAEATALVDEYKDYIAADALAQRGEKALGILGDASLSVADRANATFAALSGNTASPPLESARADSPVTESANDTKVPKQKRDRKSRGRRIKAAASEYFVRLLKGEDVKKEEVAKKHGFHKETNVLSKNETMQRYGLSTIEDAINEAVQCFGSIGNIDSKENARISNIIYNRLCR